MESRVCRIRRRPREGVDKAVERRFLRGNGNRQVKSLRFRGLQRRLSELPWSVWWDCDGDNGLGLDAMLKLLRNCPGQSGGIATSRGRSPFREALKLRNCPGQSGGIATISSASVGNLHFNSKLPWSVWWDCDRTRSSRHELRCIPSELPWSVWWDCDTITTGKVRTVPVRTSELLGQHGGTC